MTTPQIGQKAPPLLLSEWVQGDPVTLEAMLGKVILLEVFQVNCPGCFFYSLPQAIDLYQQYHDQGLEILGIATAFEDFELNTLANLQQLLMYGDTVGATQAAFTAYGNEVGRLPYVIPFPVAMDLLTQQSSLASEDNLNEYLDQHLPQFSLLSLVEQNTIQQQVRNYLQSKLFAAATFDSYHLQGTPSQILIDKQGRLRASHFGDFDGLESLIRRLLKE